MSNQEDPFQSILNRICNSIAGGYLFPQGITIMVLIYEMVTQDNMSFHMIFHLITKLWLLSILKNALGRLNGRLISHVRTYFKVTILYKNHDYTTGINRHKSR